MKKIAVVFPGIGYHVDKPLLYYSRKLAGEAGFSVVEVPYCNFPKRIRGDKEKTRQAFETGLAQAEEILKDIDYSRYDQILFISKSIGTAIAAAYARKQGLSVRHVFYTPLVETFDFIGEKESSGKNMIAFHGTSDPWADTEALEKECIRRRIPLYITEEGNHSLETGNALKDLGELQKVMEDTRRFVNN